MIIDNQTKSRNYRPTSMSWKISLWNCYLLMPPIKFKSTQRVWNQSRRNSISPIWTILLSTETPRGLQLYLNRRKEPKRSLEIHWIRNKFNLKETKFHALTTFKGYKKIGKQSLVTMMEIHTCLSYPKDLLIENRPIKDLDRGAKMRPTAAIPDNEFGPLGREKNEDQMRFKILNRSQ